MSWKLETWHEIKGVSNISENIARERSKMLTFSFPATNYESHIYLSEYNPGPCQ